MQAVYLQSAIPDARESNSHYGVIVKYPVSIDSHKRGVEPSLG